MKKQILLRTAAPLSRISDTEKIIEPILSHIVHKKSDNIRIVLNSFYISLLAVYIFGFEYLPIQDYPNWLYQGFLFKELILGGNIFHGFYHVYSYIPPNAICTLAIGCLSLVVSPFLAGKIFLFATALVSYLGITSYLSLYIKDQKLLVASTAFYFVFSLHFLMGFMNFCFGSGIALMAIAYIIKKDLSVNRFFFAAIFLLLYISHFFALGFVILFLLVYVFHTKQYHKLLRLLPTFVPVMLLFLHYYFTKTIGDLPVAWNNDSLKGQMYLKLLTIFEVIFPFHRYKWMTEPGSLLFGIDYLMSLIITLATALVFYHAWKEKKWTINLRLLILLLLFMIVLPHYFGGLIFPAARLVIFFILILMAVLFSGSKLINFRLFIGIAMCILSSVTYSYNLINAFKFDAQVRNNSIPMDAFYCPRYAFEGTDGYMHLIFYHGITHKEPLRPFRSGIFDYPAEEINGSFRNRH